MARKRRWFGGLVACIGGSAVLAACGGTGPDETLISNESAARNGALEAGALPDGARLLTEVKAAGGAFLQVYEMENGDIAAMGRIDDGHGALLPGTSAAEADGLADLYTAVAGAHADPAILAKLAASDEATRVESKEATRLELSPEERLEPTLDKAALNPPLDAMTGQPDVSTRLGCVIQSAAFYAADAEDYKDQFCKTLGGLGSIHCELNVASFNDGWHRARNYRSDSFNQTLCNNSIHLNKWRYPGHAKQFVNTLGPRQHSVFVWNTSRGDMDFHTESKPLDGPEASHLCTSVNRKQ